MSQKIANELGSVYIDEDVIAIIAGLSAMECYGLVGMASKRVQDGLSELLGKESMRRGVKLLLNEEKITVELHVIVEYGINISEVANNMIERVFYSIKKMTGVEVERIKIYVEGVRIGDAS